MTSTALAERPIRELQAIEPVVLHDGTSIIDALAVLTDEQWSVVLVPGRHGPKAITRADVEALLPSPAAMLSRHELVDRVDRVAVREAIRYETMVVEGNASVGEAIEAMRVGGWRPVVVMEEGVPSGVHTSASLLSAVGASVGGDDAVGRGATREVVVAGAPASRPRQARQRRTTALPTELGLASASAFGLPLLVEAERRRELYARVGEPSGLLSDVRVLAGWVGGVWGRLHRR